MLTVINSALFSKIVTFKKLFLNLAVGPLCLFSLIGCQSGATIMPVTQELALSVGPPISDIVTPFDNALQCLQGKVPKQVAFGVGAILDQTGKNQIANGGAGKFITQGAGDIVQSALFKAGAVVVNRRDPRIQETETNWGIRDNSKVMPVRYYITGSINSLDFLPGAGFDVQVAGIGPKYRQHRVLVGLDLAMTDSLTSRIVANVPLQKQIVATEVSVGIGRFFNSTLVSLDVGGGQREALHFALRQMLNLATFELLSQVLHPDVYSPCREEFSRVHGNLDNARSSKKIRDFQKVADKIAEEDFANLAEDQIAVLPAKRILNNSVQKLDHSHKEKVKSNTEPADGEPKNDLVIYGKNSVAPQQNSTKLVSSNSSEISSSKPVSIIGEIPVSETASLKVIAPT